MGSKKSVDRPATMSIVLSLDPDTYDRLCYVADYFEWPLRRVASNALIRVFSNVKFGEDLDRADWSDPRRLKKSKLEV